MDKIKYYSCYISEDSYILASVINKDDKFLVDQIEEFSLNLEKEIFINKLSKIKNIDLIIANNYIEYKVGHAEGLNMLDKMKYIKNMKKSFLINDQSIVNNEEQVREIDVNKNLLIDYFTYSQDNYVFSSLKEDVYIDKIHIFKEVETKINTSMPKLNCLLNYFIGIEKKESLILIILEEEGSLLTVLEKKKIVDIERLSQSYNIEREFDLQELLEEIEVYKSNCKLKCDVVINIDKKISTMNLSDYVYVCGIDPIIIGNIVR